MRYAQGRLPVAGTISDDNGLGRVWFTTPSSGGPCRGEKSSDDEDPANPRRSVHNRAWPIHRLRISVRTRIGQRVPPGYTELPKHPAEYVVKEADVKADN